MPGWRTRRSRCSCRQPPRVCPAGPTDWHTVAAGFGDVEEGRPPPPPYDLVHELVRVWIISRPETLTEIVQLRLKAVLASCPELDALTAHVRSFARILTERQGERLPEWLDAVRQDDLPSLHTLAAGIDRDAVIAGPTPSWNSGVVEGHVNRIKMLKRQMFGRAGFDLLRERVLLAE
ncbi:transposase [Streptomyces sp. HB132]|uniref:transposase n=1 Tax=Streptomyces sp. HB132 TaxID=767388 RepID=UPI001EF7791A|nr:transposase [Streptomyces sp. HB132]